MLPNLERVPGILGEICRRRLSDVLATLDKPAPSGKAAAFHDKPSFREALLTPGLSIIAEVKRKSPSQGSIAPLDAAHVASEYAKGGAKAISVLTELHYFGGNDQDLIAVCQAVDLPVLRKDFTVHPSQIAEAAKLGASALLLIVAALGELTAEYLAEAEQAGLDALVEVHDERELLIALESRASIIGVNNRNLADLTVDLSTAPALGKKAREKGFDGVLVAESGYASRADLEPLGDIFDAVLVGSSLAQSGDWRAKVSLLSSD